MILHNQLLLNGYSNNPMTDIDELELWLSKLIREIGMKVTMGPHAFYVDKPGNRGLTGIVGLETSHAAVHVWDEAKPASFQFDLYTCSHLPLREVLELLEHDWELTSYEYLVLEREHGFTIVDRGSKYE